MNISFVTYGLLVAAVVCEALGESFLEKTDGLVHVRHIIVSLCFFGIAFVLEAYILKTMPVGVMYAIWCGLGIVLVGILGSVLNKQTLDAPALIGMALIAVGVAVICLYSKSVAG